MISGVVRRAQVGQGGLWHGRVWSGPVWCGRLVYSRKVSRTKYFGEVRQGMVWSG